MTSGEEKPELIRAAEAVSDGTPLEPAGTASTPEDPVLEHLRVIEAIARVHGEGEEPPRDPAPAIPASSEEAPAAIGTWGHLLLLERIGSGSFSDVYRAYDRVLEVEVALKLFDPGSLGESGSRYLDEARRLARVRHPNVIVIHGADEHDGRVGLWTEFLRGQTLAQSLAERGPLSSSEAAVVGVELCRALAAVHAAGLVHRDVKAENVIREQGGRLVLLDFGAMDAPSDAPLTREERGTPIAMAPEQLECGPVGPAADIYGSGVLLYHLVTGRYPIEAETPAELVERHRTGTFVPLRDRRADLPADFVRVVERALDPVPAKRFASAGEMERGLAALAQHRDPSRRGWWLAGVLAAASVLAMVSLFAWRSFTPPVRPIPEPGPPTPQALSATAALFMDRGGGPAPLKLGDSIAPGDALFLRLSSSEPIYAYVLDEDASGALYALFPVRGASPGNPLSAAAEHRLPGTIQGKPFDWQVTTAGGSESICVIASRAPIEAIESELSRIPPAQPHTPVSYAKIPGVAVDRLRGLGGMTEAIAPDSTQRLAELIRELRARPRTSDVPWVWEMTLENPGGRSH